MMVLKTLGSLVPIFLRLFWDTKPNPTAYTVWWNPVELIPEWDEYEIIEGDILIPKNRTIERRNALYGDEHLWEDGIIPFEFREDFTEEEKNMALSAMVYLQENTCVRFVQRNSHKTFVLFQKEPKGCSSLVGRGAIPGRLPLNLQAPGCFTKGIILHELLHVLGLYHEHARPDRDRYVDIHWNNIRSTAMNSFHKINHTTTFGLPYGYDSILQYDRYSFSANGKPTITAKFQPNRPLGQRLRPTRNDIEKISRMYKCIR